MVWILIGIYSCIMIIELPPLLNKKWYKELGVFVIVFAIGIYMSLAFYYQWPLLEPFQAINANMETA